ncbi:pentapeptide repeat-containing protein [Streptomyces sp. NPDC006465]|uniref:pentapeptide repeat-containing protein n=1 Tax=Streptomyces sp. NPDC006465 TaxID=3157174 RepID=UPI0033B47594
MNPASLVDWIESRDLPATALTVAAAILVADLIWAGLDRTKPDAANEDAVQAHTERRRTRVIVGGIASTIAITVLLVWAPWWVEGHHLRDKNGELVSSAGIIITGFRTMVIAIVAGGFTAAGLWYTHRSHQQTEKLFEHTREKDREQAELTREGQVTGRYVEAIKLLASGTVHERLGGIYALERIMIDSDRDHKTIVEVLAAFIRRELLEATERNLDNGARSNLHTLAEDVGASLTVLSRREEADLRDRPVEIPGAQMAHHDLAGVNWRHFNLKRAKLEGANLNSAQLSHTDLNDADLTEAVLTGAMLQYASLSQAQMASSDLVRANLEGAHLDGAHLRYAIMNKANLSRARLIGALLDHASLNDADLGGADLRRAHLRGARLRDAKLEGAKLQHADLGQANLQGAQLDGADLSFARLAKANLRGAKLDKTTGLSLQELCTTHLIYRNTKLPPELANDPRLQAIVQEAEEDSEAQAEAAYLAALANEEELMNGTAPEEG